MVFSPLKRPAPPKRSAAGGVVDESIRSRRAGRAAWATCAGSPTCLGRGGRTSPLLLLLFLQLLEHLGHLAELLGVLRAEVAVALGLALDDVHGLPGVLGQDLVEAGAVLEDFVGLDFDVGDLAADLAPGLVDHDLR